MKQASKKTILVVGGAGFIGVNSANRFLKKGHRVIVLDNLSRKGAASNLAWLRKNHKKVIFEKADIRDYKKVKKVFGKYKKIDVVLHLAAQVAVTTSVVDPREDFDINALGTFNVLEAVRETYKLSSAKKKKAPFFINASTNKVYGGMEDIKIVQSNGRYQYRDFKRGIPEDRLLDFHSPYGCSKGAADQYVLDYQRIYGLDTVSFRQSCIYGYRQFGVEDQGWVAWFIIASVLGKKITVYGDGKQVRDVLFIEDLIDAYEGAIKNRRTVSGKAYNIGGGPKNQMSLLELIAFIEKWRGKKLKYSFDDWRPGDQPVFVCDIRKAKKDFGWQPKTSVKNGVKTLYEWVAANKKLF
ncbi:MAG: SDR family NAD(P)-dependent oxidoreductase [Nitrospinota bacterium]